MPPRSSRLRKLHPALDSTKKLDSVSSKAITAGKHLLRRLRSAFELCSTRSSGIGTNSDLIFVGFKTPAEAIDG